MDRIIVIGGGGHARVLICALQAAGRAVAGYTDPIDRGPLYGVPYLGTDDGLAGLRARDPRCGAVLGLGKLDASDRRLRIADRLADLGFALPAVVARHAVVAPDVDLGAGTVVLDGAVVNCGARIGRACILNTNCTVEHDCRLGDDVHVAPAAALSGGVEVGDHVLIGTGASVVQGVRIGARIAVGAGAAVVRDLVEAGVYAGCPARRLR